jgi:hypothetical protein
MVRLVQPRKLDQVLLRELARVYPRLDNVRVREHYQVQYGLFGTPIGLFGSPMTGRRIRGSPPWASVATWSGRGSRATAGSGELANCA